MKITIVRHAQTDANYEDKIQGRSNDSLAEAGIRQCKKLRQKLDSIKFDYCYCSPLLRAMETALILIGDKTLIIRDDRLIERDLGELEGLDRSLYDVKKYWDYKLNSSDKGVERIQDVFKRCRDFLDEIMNKYDDDKHILIVTHGSPCRAIHHILKNTDLSTNLHGFKIENCYVETINTKK